VGPLVTLGDWKDESEADRGVLQLRWTGILTWCFSYFGPLALVRDDRKVILVQKQQPVKPSISLYTSSGKLMEPILVCYAHQSHALAPSLESTISTLTALSLD
jgi:hypothetical protein